MDSDVIISIEWTLPADPDTDRVSYFIERVSNTEHHNTLTFAPLSSSDSGVYVCHANVSGDSEFVTGTAHSQATHTLSVESECIYTLAEFTYVSYVCLFDKPFIFLCNLSVCSVCIYFLYY